MESTSLAEQSLSAEHLAALRRAKHELETPALAMKLASIVGAPLEKLLSRMPAIANEKVTDATQLALRKCLQIALRTLARQDAATALMVPDKPSNLLHKFAVAATGAAGGAFGLFALPVELPVTTTLMFRSICDIARSEGEDLSS
ncbi:MAG: EcsC family protein, partial [Paraburkholderia sp.]